MAGRTGRLQQEIRQTRPFQSAYHEAFLGVMKTADCFRRAVAGIVAPFGITPQQYNVLRILRGAEPEGLPTLAIAERLIEETPGMTRLIDRLEAKGLIRRTRCKEDRRQVLCRATPAGLDLLKRIDPLIGLSERRLAAAWKESEAKTVIRLLDAAREAMAGPLLPQEPKRQRSKRSTK
jgi:DNA-binding MarR family transcriptional regulator